MDESRRDLIKKAAVATGVLWSAPVIESVTRAASAAGTPEPTTTSTTRPEPFCSDASTCTRSGGQIFNCEGFPGQCACGSLAEGGIACIDPWIHTFSVLDEDAACPPGSTCDQIGSNCLCLPQPCSSTSECAPGSVCVTNTCQGSFCLPVATAEGCAPSPGGHVYR
jgi:hypothetical protein